jgi:glycosyltransferase involved in cell wall biosynthesis
MANNSLVTVIIIFLNAAEFIQEAIESVLAQSYKKWELLLVDDGSHDESTDLAIKFASQYPSQIKYLEHDGHQNLGMSAARNLGLRNAKGNYVAFLDADDYWLSNKLEVQVKLLDSRPDVGMVFGSTKYWFSWTGRPEDSRRDYIPLLSIGSNTLFRPPSLLARFLEGKAEVPCTCSILVRLDAAQKVGGFEDTFRGMYEDQAFYAKICLTSAVMATGDCLAWYRQYQDSSTSVANRLGRMLETREEYLNWLASYLTEVSCQNQSLWQSLRRELWLLKSPAWLPQARQLLPYLRWTKKWLLRTGLRRFG